MTELSFLIDLLLNHDLPKPTKDAIAMRIREVEASICNQNLAASKLSPIVSAPRSQNTSSVPMQAQSTLDAIARHEAMGFTAPQLPIVHPQQLPPEMPPIPVEQVAQTAAAAQAINSRNQAISEAIAGKIDKVNGRPRKF
jgi:hypothetical protein